MTIKKKACIVGVYEHPTRKADQISLAQLHAEVARGALADAGLGKDDVDGYFCAGDAPGLSQDRNLDAASRDGHDGATRLEREQQETRDHGRTDAAARVPETPRVDGRTVEFEVIGCLPIRSWSAALTAPSRSCLAMAEEEG